MRGRTIRTPKKREKFLEVLRETANISEAARAIGVGRMSVYDWRNEDTDFAAAWDEAVEEGLDYVEAEVRRRAIDGVAEPIFYKGEEIAEVRRYSDTLLMFYLKGCRPSKYRESAIKLNIDLTKLSDEQLERLARGEHPAAVLGNPSESGVGASASSPHIN